jgi:hypothetical protein
MYRTWLFLGATILLAGCKNAVNNPQLEPHVDPPAYVVGMKGTWTFEFSSSLAYNSQRFNCEIIDATVEVGQVIGISGAWYELSATLKDAKLRCTQDSLFVWEIDIDSLHAYMCRVEFGLKFSFGVETPFGWLSCDCRTEYIPELDESKWNGPIDLNIPPNDSMVPDGFGTWRLVRKV